MHQLLSSFYLCQFYHHAAAQAIIIDECEIIDSCVNKAGFGLGQGAGRSRDCFFVSL
jgi:hypothetical protein